MWEDLNELRENQLYQLSNPRSRFFYLSVFFFRANESVLVVQSLLFPPFSFQAESRKRKKKEKESVFSRLATPLSSDFTFPYLVQHSQSIRRSCKTNCLFAPMTKLPHSFPFFRARQWVNWNEHHGHSEWSCVFFFQKANSFAASLATTSLSLRIFLESSRVPKIETTASFQLPFCQKLQELSMRASIWEDSHLHTTGIDKVIRP